MRELRPGQIRSRGRDEHRERYAAYMRSPAWFRRRNRWVEEESARVAPSPVFCHGGCGRQWAVSRDDLHHCSYDRLGDEQHADLWAMCRSCHDQIHALMDSAKSWRKLPLRLRNEQALAVIRDRAAAPPGLAARTAADFL